MLIVYINLRQRYLLLPNVHHHIPELLTTPNESAFKYCSQVWGREFSPLYMW